MGTLETMRGNEVEKGSAVDMDTLYFLGGIALCVFGAGLVLSNPTVRKYMSKVSVGNLVGDSMPDLERYLRIRAM